MDIIEIGLISIITSGSFVGFLYFILKKLIAKMIEYEYEKRSKLFGRKVDFAYETERIILNKELTIYPEISEIIYRTRNSMRDMVEENDIIKWDTNSFSSHVYLLTENLYKYRVFIKESTFKSLHSYKHLLQDFHVLIDTATQNISKENGSDEILNIMKRKYLEADVLYNKIIDEIKEALKRKAYLLINKKYNDIQ